MTASSDRMRRVRSLRHQPELQGLGHGLGVVVYGELLVPPQAAEAQ